LRAFRNIEMTLGTAISIVLLLMLVAAMPTWSYSRNWGYGPSGMLGLALVVMALLYIPGWI
jgi:hypothetical protein